MKINHEQTFPLFSLLIILALVTLYPGRLPAQDIFGYNISSRQVCIREDFYHFFRVGRGLAAAPLRFNRQDWEAVGLTAAGTAALFGADRKTRALALANRSKANDLLFNVDHFQGNQYSVLLCAGLYGYGLFTDNGPLRRMGRSASEAFIYSGSITTMLKLLLGRRRPYAGNSHLVFKPFQLFDDAYQALPSGHTTVSFAVSTALAQSRDNPYWKIFWYGTAAMVGASRIYHNKHWLSDVALGAVIGYGVGAYVIRFDAPGTSRLGGSRLQPRFGPNTIGVSLILK